MPSPGDSDHCSVIMTIASREREDAPVTQRNIKKANWNVCGTSNDWKRLRVVSYVTNEDALADVYGRIETAAADAISIILPEAELIPGMILPEGRNN